MISFGVGGPITRKPEATLAGGSDHKSYGLARSRMRPPTVRSSTRTGWRGVRVIRLLQPLPSSSKYSFARSTSRRSRADRRMSSCRSISISSGSASSS